MRMRAQARLNALMARLITILLVSVLSTMCLHAGGPEYVAGSTYFNSGTMGQPIIWYGGQVNYYTDQGDLSPILSNAAANALVASSFSQWTSVSIAGFSATAAGQLQEDVNGGNIQVNSEGIVTAPADITPQATYEPVGIVYDYDGTVTDALLGSGAGDASQCFWNAVYGGPDNFNTNATFSHALVVINGQCALQSSQLTDVQYRLVRVLGKVIGLGWSQLNVNVVTGNPPPTPADYAGFPVMHYLDPAVCVPITACYPNPYQLAPDDMAALSRLYPPNGGSGTTARIYGSIYFMDRFGNPGQPMQGVNVYARWIDPTTGLPSHQYAASSVSGFLFTGNAGNPITGWDNPFGTPYSEFGSSDQTAEGFFDLGGLPIPNGETTAEYQLSIEPLDPLWSAGVGPYAPSQVSPSGTMQPMIVTVTAGGEAEQDLVMDHTALAIPPWASSETWNSPAQVPPAGDWMGSLSGYGVQSYFLLSAQANRTLSVSVTAMEETGEASESKSEPVIGIWTFGDAFGAPPSALTTSPFNTGTFGMTQLNAQVYSSNKFVIGISDLRGDGRPDYAYQAHVLYADSAIPARLPVSGGPITLQGTGFIPQQNVRLGSSSLTPIATNASQVLISAPAQVDGVQAITVTDPVSGASSAMTDAVTFGAAATDQLILLQGANPPIPIGTQSPVPVMVRAVASDGLTPVSGATIAWSASNSAALSACGGQISCSVLSDENGIASTEVTPTIAGNITVAAQLAPAVYNPAQTVVATVTTAPAPPVSVEFTTPYLWIAQGASLGIPLTAHVVNQNGTAMSGVTVNFSLIGEGSLSAPAAITNSAGDASVTLTVTSISAGFQVNACAQTGSNPCANMYGNVIASGALNLQPVSGAGQVIVGSSFQPLALRVVDSVSPPNPVMGASVVFQALVGRPAGDNLALATDPEWNNQNGMPIILSSTQVTVQSGSNGIASIIPSVSSFSGILELQIQVSAGSATIEDVMESFPQ